MALLHPLIFSVYLTALVTDSLTKSPKPSAISKNGLVIRLIKKEAVIEYVSKRDMGEKHHGHSWPCLFLLPSGLFTTWGGTSNPCNLNSTPHLLIHARTVFGYAPGFYGWDTFWSALGTSSVFPSASRAGMSWWQNKMTGARAERSGEEEREMKDSDPCLSLQLPSPNFLV